MGPLTGRTDGLLENSHPAEFAPSIEIDQLVALEKSSDQMTCELKCNETKSENIANNSFFMIDFKFLNRKWYYILAKMMRV